MLLAWPLLALLESSSKAAVTLDCLSCFGYLAISSNSRSEKQKEVITDHRQWLDFWGSNQGQTWTLFLTTNPPALSLIIVNLVNNDMENPTAPPHIWSCLTCILWLPEKHVRFSLDHHVWMNTQIFFTHQMWRRTSWANCSDARSKACRHDRAFGHPGQVMTSQSNSGVRWALQIVSRSTMYSGYLLTAKSIWKKPLYKTKLKSHCCKFQHGPKPDKPCRPPLSDA